MLLLLSSCANEPLRSIASEPITYGIVDMGQSGVKFVSPEVRGLVLEHHLSMYFKDSQGNFVDFETDSLKVWDRNGREISFKINRHLLGQYYVTIVQKLTAPALVIDFKVHGKALRIPVTLNNRQASASHSNLKKVKEEGNRILLRLDLADESGRIILLSNPPEIIVGGSQIIEEIKQIRDGRWEFWVRVLETNHILYFSIRADGVYLPNFYRYQHVEK
ncbi:MAG TPA: hypothetical protein VNJ01_04205 [Bacteriovoracaceae bacterium]|nr:hypothetical protein [Bacteriovoracaceae bacterium]